MFQLNRDYWQLEIGESEIPSEVDSISIQMMLKGDMLASVTLPVKEVPNVQDDVDSSFISSFTALPLVPCEILVSFDSDVIFKSTYGNMIAVREITELVKEIRNYYKR